MPFPVIRDRHFFCISGIPIAEGPADGGISMAIEQRTTDPDVNSFNIGETDPGDGSGDNGDSTEDVPTTPNRPVVPVEEPPGTGGPPAGDDVDESPKKIA